MESALFAHQLLSQQALMIVLQWVSDGSPSHSHATKIENNNQFVPENTNPKEFKKIQKLVRKHLLIFISTPLWPAQLHWH